MITSFRDLEVWQMGIDVTVRVYRVTCTLPAEEKFGLMSQMRRAAVSVPANIAEGWARDHTAEYLRHLSIARGSLAELETHLVIAVELDYVKESRMRELNGAIEQLGRKLNTLQQALRQRLQK